MTGRVEQVKIACGALRRYYILKDRLCNMILDDGNDFMNLSHIKYPQLLWGIQGISEKTRVSITASTRWWPKVSSISVNNFITNSKFSNLYRCLESLIDGIRQGKDVLIRSKMVVVSGYADVGKGCVPGLKGFEAQVIINEIDSINALQEGFHWGLWCDHHEWSLISLGYIDTILDQHFVSVFGFEFVFAFEAGPHSVALAALELTV